MISRDSLGSASEAAGLKQTRNLVDLVLLRATESGKVAARYKAEGRWKDLTWGEFADRVRKLSEGLLALGIKAGDRVCLFSNTRMEWALADMAIVAAGAITVPIYGSNTPQEVEYIVNDCGARAIVFDHDVPEARLPGRWQRLLGLAGKLPTVEHFIAFEVPSKPEQRLISLADLEKKGVEALKTAAPKAMEARARLIGEDDLSCIYYTSGTTGNPKGVMLTHRNWTYQAKAVVECGLLATNDTALLFLPLAHSFAKVVEAAWLGQGFVLAFAESIEKAVDNCAEVGATVLPAVPRVFEKAYNKVVSDGSAQPGVKGRLFAWAMKLFDEYAAARAAGREYSSVQWTLARKLVFTKIEEKLQARFGGRMRAFISGGAPLAKKVGYFFDLCGLLILEGYGLTETSAPTHANRPEMRKIGTVGLAFPQVETRIAEDGEILVRGPQVMKGYYNRPEETAQVLEADGWFHTGDIGEVDGQGFLRITDRKKDLIKTSGGKYIAPQELENGLKTEPLISQVAIIGDRRQFVTALITISEENVAKFATEKGMSGMSYKALTQRPEVRARVQAAVDGLNAALPSYATIKKFAILDDDWSQATGELTPKLNIRRKVIAEKFKKEIDALYGAESLD